MHHAWHAACSGHCVERPARTQSQCDQGFKTFHAFKCGMHDHHKCWCIALHVAHVPESIKLRTFMCCLLLAGFTAVLIFK